MSCRSRELLLDPRAPDREALLAHAATCAECSSLLALQAETNARLAAPVEGLDAIARARVWEKIDAAREERPRSFEWRWLAPIAAAAVIAGVLLLWPKDQVEPGQWIDYAAAEVVELEGAKLAVKTPAKIAYSNVALGRELRVFRGTLEVDASWTTPPPLDVETPHARILALGAKYRLDVQKDRTTIEVESGEARIMENGVERVLTAGQRAELGVVVAQVEKIERVEEIAPAETAIEQPVPEDRPRPAPKKKQQSVEDAITEARAMVGKDDRRAVQLAEAVLERHPQPAAQIEAMMIAADAHRRAGELTVAQRRYAQVVGHSAAGAYREEAILRRAAVLADLGRSEEAIALLANAPAGGNLRPERAALEARLRLERGDLDGAQRVLKTVEASNDRVLTPVRVRLEEKLRGEK